jgi:hypothetical protein
MGKRVENNSGWRTIFRGKKATIQQEAGTQRNTENTQRYTEDLNEIHPNHIVIGV